MHLGWLCNTEEFMQAILEPFRKKQNKKNHLVQQLCFLMFDEITRNRVFRYALVGATLEDWTEQEKWSDSLPATFTHGSRAPPLPTFQLYHMAKRLIHTRSRPAAGRWGSLNWGNLRGRTYHRAQLVTGVKGRVGRNWIQVVTHRGGCRQQKQGLLNGSTCTPMSQGGATYLSLLFTLCAQCVVYTVCEVFSMCTCGCLERAEEVLRENQPGGGRGESDLRQNILRCQIA